MQISGYGAISQSQWPSEQQRRTRATTENAERRGDTVSFSAEALELLARAQASKTNTDTEKTEYSPSKDAKEKDAKEKDDTTGSALTSTSTATSSSASSSSSSSSDGFGETSGEQAEAKAESSSVHEKNKQSTTDTDVDSKIKGLKGQIVQLAGQIAKIYELPLEPRLKEEMAKPLEDRISLIEQEIAALEAQKEQQAKGAQTQA